MTIDDELAASAAAMDAHFAASQPALVARLRAHGVTEVDMRQALALCCDAFERERAAVLERLRGLVRRIAALQARIAELEAGRSARDGTEMGS